jgi:hypothetical protein
MGILSNSTLISGSFGAWASKSCWTSNRMGCRSNSFMIQALRIVMQRRNRHTKTKFLPTFNVRMWPLFLPYNRDNSPYFHVRPLQADLATRGPGANSSGFWVSKLSRTVQYYPYSTSGCCMPFRGGRTNIDAHALGANPRKFFYRAEGETTYQCPV